LILVGGSASGATRPGGNFNASNGIGTVARTWSEAGHVQVSRIQATARFVVDGEV